MNTWDDPGRETKDIIIETQIGIFFNTFSLKCVYMCGGQNISIEKNYPWISIVQDLYQNDTQIIRCFWYQNITQIKRTIAIIRWVKQKELANNENLEEKKIGPQMCTFCVPFQFKAANVKTTATAHCKRFNFFFFFFAYFTHDMNKLNSRVWKIKPPPRTFHR